MRVTVDKNVCQGHGVCLMVADRIFDIDDADGLAWVVMQPQTDAERNLARQAQGNCPERAIRIEED
ncbi:ferredoxin [Microbacterium sp. CPCC 204701]|uniref:ferredoxin n=1 Tax=Microbacterium sp. CPCC 204701 TaxID=2493084 RepID=UPI000FD8E3DE|nr:ferredoxin [Microbacterium sp. CPCC 204701]